jgi:anti-sigma regulatory factor (Ser/Thr protein kinase)
VKETRRWLAGLLPPSSARDDIELIVSELATNALVHTASGASGGTFDVDVAWWPEAVQVAVRDGGGASTTPRVIHDAPGEQQRGLELVAAISAGWDFTDDDARRVVRAECRWAADGGPVPESLPSEQEVNLCTAALAAWFPDVPVWCGLDGWLALLPPPGGLVGARSPADLGRVIACRLTPSWTPPAMATGSLPCEAVGRDRRLSDTAVITAMTAGTDRSHASEAWQQAATEAGLAPQARPADAAGISMPSLRRAVEL